MNILISELEYVDCPVCGPFPRKVWIDEGKGTHYVRCRSCRTIYASPRVSRVARYRWFEENYGIGEKAFEYAATRRRTLASEAALIGRHVSSGAMLDVGCDTGQFFKWFGSAAWQRYGVELVSSAAVYAAQTYDAQVRAGVLQDALFPDAYFDLATLIDMFYFTEDPGGVLQEILRILKPEGLLAIEIPGQTYQIFRSYGLLPLILDRHWTRIHPDSPYLFWFNPTSLQRLLENNGFQVLEWHVVPAFDISNRVARLAWNICFSILAKWARMDFRALTFAPKYLCLATPRKPSEHTVLDSTIPQSGKVIIQRGMEHQVAAIIALHAKYIMPSVPEAIELDFLDAYYGELICCSDGVIYIATTSGQVVGYASLVRDQSKLLRRLSWKHPLLMFVLFWRLLFSRNLRKRMGFRFKSELLGGKWGANLREGRSLSELRAVAVREDHRGEGIGDGLLRVCLDHARRIKWDDVIAWVREDNAASNQLFQRVGFRRIGSRIEFKEKTHLLLWQPDSAETKEAVVPRSS